MSIRQLDTIQCVSKASPEFPTLMPFGLMVQHCSTSPTKTYQAAKFYPPFRIFARERIVVEGTSCIPPSNGASLLLKGRTFCHTCRRDRSYRDINSACDVGRTIDSTESSAAKICDCFTSPQVSRFTTFSFSVKYSSSGFAASSVGGFIRRFR